MGYVASVLFGRKRKRKSKIKRKNSLVLTYRDAYALWERGRG